MITIRRAETDVDLEAWRRVRIAVLPNERCASVEEMRKTATPGSLFLVAELTANSPASGIAGRSDIGGQGFLAPRVLSQMRRNGVGARLLRELAAHVERIGFRGLAAILKRFVLARAAENGVREIHTWTQDGNAAMRTLNEKLGYLTRTISIAVRGSLPLPP